jgi:hypothetical protein
LQERLQAQRKSIRENNPDGLAQQLSEEIPPELVKELSQTQRERVYPHEVTFWTWFAQTLKENASCAWAVSHVQQWMRALGLSVPSSKTSSYVAARQSLPEEMLRSIHQHLIVKLDQNLGSKHLWRGFRVRATDATSAQMPDTASNQKAYPQPSGQAPGCGFPVVKLGGLIDLGHGGLQDFAEGTLKTGEMRCYDQLENYLVEGDLLAADRLYSSFEVVGRLKLKGVEFVGRNHHARKVDFRRGKKIGPNERRIVWEKPQRQPALSRLSAEEWEALPDTIELRIIRTKGPDREGKTRTRYVVTTLLDPKLYPAEEVASLYLHRWEIELRFRDIKTTMGMEMLRTQSPEMIRKEILMHMIAYNALRLLMLKAANIHGCSHRRISFKGVIQVLEGCVTGFAKARGQPRLLELERSNLFARIAERIVPDRPGRHEPRKKKRRPKSYGWLQRPRHEYFEHFREQEPALKIIDQAA